MLNVPAAKETVVIRPVICIPDKHVLRILSNDRWICSVLKEHREVAVPVCAEVYCLYVVLLEERRNLVHRACGCVRVNLCPLLRICVRHAEKISSEPTVAQEHSYKSDHESDAVPLEDECSGKEEEEYACEKCGGGKSKEAVSLQAMVRGRGERLRCKVLAESIHPGCSICQQDGMDGVFRFFLREEVNAEFLRSGSPAACVGEGDERFTIALWWELGKESLSGVESVFFPQKQDVHVDGALGGIPDAQRVPSTFNICGCMGCLSRDHLLQTAHTCCRRLHSHFCCKACLCGEDESEQEPNHCCIVPPNFLCACTSVGSSSSTRLYSLSAFSFCFLYSKMRPR